MSRPCIVEFVSSTCRSSGSILRLVGMPRICYRVGCRGDTRQGRVGISRPSSSSMADLVGTSMSYFCPSIAWSECCTLGWMGILSPRTFGKSHCRSIQRCSWWAMSRTGECWSCRTGCPCTMVRICYSQHLVSYPRDKLLDRSCS